MKYISYSTYLYFIEKIFLVHLDILNLHLLIRCEVRGNCRNGNKNSLSLHFWVRQSLRSHNYTTQIINISDIIFFLTQKKVQIVIFYSQSWSLYHLLFSLWVDLFWQYAFGINLHNIVLYFWKWQRDEVTLGEVWSSCCGFHMNDIHKITRTTFPQKHTYSTSELCVHSREKFIEMQRRCMNHKKCHTHEKAFVTVSGFKTWVFMGFYGQQTKWSTATMVNHLINGTLKPIVCHFPMFNPPH